MPNLDMTPTSREMMLYFHLYIFSLAILFVIIPLMKRHFATRSNFGHTLFNTMIYLDIAVLSFDMLTWWLYGKSFAGAVLAHIFSMSIYYALEAIVFYVWVLYSVYKLYRSRRAVKKRAPIYGIFLLAYELLVILNIPTEFLFRITDDNLYERGQGYFSVFVYSIVVVVFITIEVMIYRKKYSDTHNKGIYVHLLVIPIAITVFRLIQLLNYGSFLTWPAFTVGIMYLYMYMQANENYFDYLTGLRNRREMDYYLNYRIKTRKKDNVLFLVFLDLNYFKQINDTYGHPIGDDAIISAANILKRVCKETEDFISRIGGDEFSIIGERKDPSAVEVLIKRINLATEDFNLTGEKPYELNFSHGIAIYDDNITKDDLVMMADREMYRHKRMIKE